MMDIMYAGNIFIRYLIKKRDEGYDINNIMFQFCTNRDLIDIITLVDWKLYVSASSIEEWVEEILKIDFKKSNSRYYYNDCLITHMVHMYFFCINQRGNNPYFVFYTLPPMLMLNSEIEDLVWDREYSYFTYTYFNVNFIRNNPMLKEFRRSGEYKELMKLNKENGWLLTE